MFANLIGDRPLRKGKFHNFPTDLQKERINEFEICEFIFSIR